MTKNEAEDRFLRRCLRNMEKTSVEKDRPTEWFDFHNRTDEVLVPSRWVTRLDEANAVNEQFEVRRSDRFDRKSRFSFV